MAASEELVGNDTPQPGRRPRRPGHGMRETCEAPVEDLQKAPELAPLPVFWDGTPGTLQVGMVCREGKESVSVQAIVPCINGTIILGVVSVEGQLHNINVTQPRRHPLADVGDETKRRELWEYDQL